MEKAAACNTRTYMSGSKKRRKKALLKEEDKKLKFSLNKFIVRTETVSSSVPVAVPIDDVAEIAENRELINSEGASGVVRASRNPEEPVEENLEGVSEAENLEGESEAENLEGESEAELNINDPGLWKKDDFEKYREHFCAIFPNQNKDLLHTSVRKIGTKERTLSENHFLRKKQNNERVSRDWLVYSPSQCALFCFVCKLYSSSDQALSATGYTDWKNVSQRLSEHENSSHHRDAVFSFSVRRNAKNRVDSSLVLEQETEFKYWRNVLRRVVEVIKFLSQRGLPMFGSDETVGSSSNGNFLGSLELISLFDPFTAEHLEKFGNVGRGKVNYLSSTIVNEFIEIMGDTVLQTILKNIYVAKYFGIILDSTPDISHIDQLSIIIRYADNFGKPAEHFLKLIPCSNHSSSNLFEVVSNEMKAMALDFSNCRGQSYDNANNMAGKYTGLQARLKTLNPLAEYVPCSAHSLNLVGSVAAECCNQVITYFGFVQNLYTFFSISTHRWDILKTYLKEDKETLTPKNLSTTRWSARADATKALRKGYLNIKSALKEIAENSMEKAGTCHEAKVLLKQINKLETAILTVVWDTILQRINRVSKTLQGPSCNLCILVPLFESLEKFVCSVRSSFDEYEKEARNFVEDDVTYVEKRKKKIPKSRTLEDSASESVVLDDRTKFICEVHNVLCDSLISQLSKRKEAYTELENKFGFLYKDINEQNKDEVHKAAEKFQQLYAADVDEDFVDEYMQFRDFIPSVNNPEEQLKKLKELKMENTFPNVDSCLRILLSMPISNSSSERSFSALKRIKNYLRSNLKQEKLNSLILLTVEREITCEINYDNIISDFAERKSRKKI